MRWQFHVLSPHMITYWISPIYDYLLKHVINQDPKDSPMLRDMKTAMRVKLQNWYSEDDQKFLTTCSFLDPRYRNYVQTQNRVCQGNLRKNIEKFVKAKDEDIITGTQG